jgi:hypothetical protein
MSLLSYSYPTSGPVKVFVSLLPSIPLEVTVYDNQDITATAELVDDGKANTIQIGPTGIPSFDMIFQAVNRKGDRRRFMTSILPGAVFSQTASISGNSRTVQCGGDLFLNQVPVAWRGGRLTVSRGSTLSIADSGDIAVRHDGRTMEIEEAADLGLLVVQI